MRTLAAAAVALLLCAPARSDDRPSSSVRSLESKSDEARAELRRLYTSYAELVQKRLDDGWSWGLLSGEIIEHPDEPILPARQLEEALKLRQKELDKLTASLKTAPPDQADQLSDRVKAKKAEVRRLTRRLGRPKGVCADWSDAVWADITRLKPKFWSVRDEPREALPRHTGAILCTPPEESGFCVVFDPWKTGTPEVYDFYSWNQGSFDARIPAEYMLHHLPETE